VTLVQEKQKQKKEILEAIKKWRKGLSYSPHTDTNTHAYTDLPTCHCIHMCIRTAERRRC
jgi:hypothetical protein